MTPTATAHAAAGVLSAPPIRVVLADDSSAIRTLLGFALSEVRGFDVVGTAEDGAQAVALVELLQPDCAVLDVEMPVVGGFEALAELRRRCPDVPVVILSGFTSPELVAQAEADGAAAYLDKSREMRQLGETIRRVVGSTTAAPRAVTPLMPTDVAPATAAAAPAASDLPSPALADLRRLEYVVGHDLAEPLRVMSGFAALLQARHVDSLDESGQVFVGHISAAAQRMQLMLADLLTYGRAGRLTPELAVVPTVAVANAALRELGSVIAEREAEVFVGELPAARADAQLLTTVLRHLVLNAVTFNTATVPTVRIDGHRLDDVAVITVADNGIGIAPAHHLRVFDLFQRLNTHEEYAGTGTGLALCRRLIDLQGGSIALDSAPGGGTTVTLTLRTHG